MQPGYAPEITDADKEHPLHPVVQAVQNYNYPAADEAAPAAIAWFKEHPRITWRDEGYPHSLIHAFLSWVSPSDYGDGKARLMEHTNLCALIGVTAMFATHVKLNPDGGW